jgi:acyl-CoA thioester hydrolase
VESQPRFLVIASAEEKAAVTLARDVGASHSHRIRVRYGECDPQGVVFNAHYFAYFDIALTELWREALGGYRTMMDEGVDLVVAEATARYKAAARFDDELDLEVEVTRAGTTSMATSLRIRRDGELLVEGEMVHVFIDREALTKTPIPERIRAALTG